MIDDLINLTQGQLLIKYWWIHAGVLAVSVFLIILDKGEGEMSAKRKVKKSEDYKPVRVGTDNGNIYLQTKAGGEAMVKGNEELTAEIYYIVPNDIAGFKVKSMQVVDYKIPQLDRIETKLDRILELSEKSNAE